MAARTTFSLATCNLYNLNLPGVAVYTDADGWDAETYRKKIAWTGTVVRGVGADVWGFQELWAGQALNDVFTEAGLTDDYHLLVPDGHTGHSIVCAGAVRKDILVGEPEWLRDFPQHFRLESSGDDRQTSEIAVEVRTFSRPLLHFRIRPRKDGKAISVYVAHLKSKAPTKVYTQGWYRDNNEYYSRHSTALGSALATIRRTVEAAALRMILTDEMKDNDNPVIILGDLNDAQLSNTLNLITGQPNYLLSGLSQGGSDTALYSTASLQQYRSLRDVYYTHIHQNVRESLDHILVSQEFYDNSRKRLWAFKGMDVFNDHLNADEHKTDGSSDHGVIRATFEYRPAKTE